MSPARREPTFSATALVEPSDFDDPLLQYDSDPSVFRARVQEPRIALEPEQALVAPSGWREGSRVPSALVLNFTVAVRLDDWQRLLFAAAEARNPTSPGYGRFLSAQAAADLAPANTSLPIVMRWLEDYKVRGAHVRAGGAFVSFGARASTAERMLGCRFWRFNAANGLGSVRAFTPYAVRADVAAATDFIAGVLHLPGDGTAAPAERAAQSAVARQVVGADGQRPASARDNAFEVVLGHGDALGAL